MINFLIFLLFGVLFVVGSFAFSYFISPHNPTEKKLSSYECGEEPIGGSWIQFNVKYYLFGLAFVIFDVEALFLIPYVLVMKGQGMAVFIEMLLFVFILSLGLAYVWRKGDLEWI